MTTEATDNGIRISHPEGHVCASLLFGEAWIHDLQVDSGDASLCIRLCLAARSWIRRQGYSAFYVWCDPSSPMLEPLKRSGFKVQQIILRSQ
jgi:hypothetical protein